jgi:hypothetical protein
VAEEEKEVAEEEKEVAEEEKEVSGSYGLILACINHVQGQMFQECF